MASGIRFGETETDTGTCFPIHFVVSVPLYVSSLTQMIRKLKRLSLLTVFDPLCMEY